MELNCKVYKDKNKYYFKLDVCIGSVYNKVRLEEIFKEFKLMIVFYVVVYKYVLLMEDSVVEFIRINVLGILNIVKLLIKYGVKKFVLVSSDKVVCFINIMGVLKCFVEFIIMNE